MSKPKLIRVQTHRGGFTIDPSQIAGCKAATITNPQTGETIEGTEILISIGIVPAPLAAALRALAEQIDEARRPSLVIPATVVPDKKLN